MRAPLIAHRTATNSFTASNRNNMASSKTYTFAFLLALTLSLTCVILSLLGVDFPWSYLEFEFMGVPMTAYAALKQTEMCSPIGCTINDTESKGYVTAAFYLIWGAVGVFAMGIIRTALFLAGVVSEARHSTSSIATCILGFLLPLTSGLCWVVGGSLDLDDGVSSSPGLGLYMVGASMVGAILASTSRYMYGKTLKVSTPAESAPLISNSQA